MISVDSAVRKVSIFIVYNSAAFKLCNSKSHDQLSRKRSGKRRRNT